MAAPLLPQVAFVEGSLPSGRRRSTRELRTALFREAATIVRAEFARPITVEELARRLASSPRQLRRAFSEVAETSFRSFLTNVRMTRADDLLTSTDIPVNEVAQRVGYRQAGQFTKAFKRTYGVTPSEFRASRRGSSRAD